VSPCGRHGRDPNDIIHYFSKQKYPQITYAIWAKIKIKHPDVFSDHVNYPGIFLANIVKQNIHLGAKF
jgi:hypothetical protein